jgi:hypothetical protein
MAKALGEHLAEKSQLLSIQVSGLTPHSKVFIIGSAGAI